MVRSLSRVTDLTWPILPLLFLSGPFSHFSVRPLDSVEKLTVSCMRHRKPGSRAAISQTMRSPLGVKESLKHGLSVRGGSGERSYPRPWIITKVPGRGSGAGKHLEWSPAAPRGRYPGRRTGFLLTGLRSVPCVHKSPGLSMTWQGRWICKFISTVIFNLLFPTLIIL